MGYTFNDWVNKLHHMIVSSLLEWVKSKLRVMEQHVHRLEHWRWCMQPFSGSPNGDLSPWKQHLNYCEKYPGFKCREPCPYSLHMPFLDELVDNLPEIPQTGYQTYEFGLYVLLLRSHQVDLQGHLLLRTRVVKIRHRRYFSAIRGKKKKKKRICRIFTTRVPESKCKSQPGENVGREGHEAKFRCLISGLGNLRRLSTSSSRKGMWRL